jgi:hypothetical protein
VAALVGLAVSIATARNARREARDASEALGLILKPSLDAHITTYHLGEDPAFMAAVVRNSSPDRAAVDVIVEVTLMDGSVWHGRTDRLDPDPTGELELTPSAEFIVRCGPELRRPQSAGVHTEKIRAVYRDERELLRWECTWTGTLAISVDGPNTMSSESREVSELRLERTRNGRWRSRASR